MRDGTLPAPGTVCEPALPVFSSDEVDFKDALTRRAHNVSADEMLLHDVGQNLRGYYSNFTQTKIVPNHRTYGR